MNFLTLRQRLLAKMAKMESSKGFETASRKNRSAMTGSMLRRRFQTPRPLHGLP